MSDWNTPLTFTAETAGSTVRLKKTGTPVVSGLQYRTDSSAEFTKYTIDDVITLANVGDYVQFQNTNETLSFGSDSAQNYVQIFVVGSVAASGNMQSMLNYITDCPHYSFYRFFNNCTGLTSIPELRAATVDYFSYGYMFYGCTNITEAEIYAETLTDDCFHTMFYGCTALNLLKVRFSDWNAGNSTTNWLVNVSESGTFYCPENLEEQRGNNYIPAGWQITEIMLNEITVTSPVNITAKVNEAINIQLEATVSDGSIPTFSAAGLPEGVTCSATGLISGTVSAAATTVAEITVSASDAESKTIAVHFLITDTETPEDTETPVIHVQSAIKVTMAQNEKLTLDLNDYSASSTGAALTFAGADLPTGIALTSAGILSGSIAQIGDYNATVIVSLQGAENAYISIAFEVNPAIGEDGDDDDEESPGGDIVITSSKKRLIGAEDINFDTTGNGDRADFEDALGNIKTLHKINASHIPLTANTRSQIGVENADAALRKLSDKVNSMSSQSDGLTANRGVFIDNAASAADINLLINKELKNLNGYTLTFSFPADVSQLLLTNILWSDFRDGTLIIDGNGVNVYDQAPIEQLFKFKDCNCKIEIKNFIFNVQYSRIGIYLDNCSNVKVADCNFHGNTNNPSTAVGGVLFNGFFSGCNFFDIGQVVSTEQVFDDISGAVQFCKVVSVDSDTMLTALGEDGKEYSLQYNLKEWEE